jgi:uncharacterized protein YbjT (DUF2867 family)
MILVAGSTGSVGGEICRLLIKDNKHLRALVRQTSDSEKVERLRKWGAELVYGDLKDRSSLDEACDGCKVVVSTVSTTLSRQQDDTLQRVDQDGQLSLVEAAEAAGVEQFIYISFPPMQTATPLEEAKRAVESRLQNGGMNYTILQPVNFMEIWLSPAVGFDYFAGEVKVFGSGDNKVSWISYRDVAKFAVAAIENQKVYNSVLPLGGPEALGCNEVIHMFENAMGKKVRVEHISADALENQRDSADDPYEKSFSALMLSLAKNEFPIEMDDTLQKLPVQQRSLSDYISEVAATLRKTEGV